MWNIGKHSCITGESTQSAAYFRCDNEHLLGCSLYSGLHPVLWCCSIVRDCCPSIPGRCWCALIWHILLFNTCHYPEINK